MVDFEFDPEYVPGVKLGLHTFQILCAFVAWCLEIAVFRDDKAQIVGNNGWTFAVCFLSIPAWIYLIMTPRWERTRRLADPRAMVTVDGVFTVFWLSAFATQASYNSAGKCGDVCGLSKAIVALGVFVTLFWAGATFVSFYTLQHFNNFGSLPGYDKRKLPSTNIDPDKAAFSMAPHDEEAYAPVNMDDRDAGRPDEYASGAYAGASYSRNDNYEDDDPNRYGSRPSRPSNNPFEGETEYHSQSQHPEQQQHQQPLGGNQVYVSPSAQDAYDEDRPAQFPAGNYDRMR